MSGGITALRKQIGELRALAAQLTASSEAVQQDEDSVAWAERVSGPDARSLAARRAPRRRSAPRHPVLPPERQVDHRRAQGRRSRPARRPRRRRRAEPAPVRRLLFRKLNRLLLAGGEKLRRETQTELETARGGLALCLPGDRPDMLRGLSLRWPTTSLLIVDEAARVRETMWATISPMLAAAPLARQALLSTPAGATGEFHRAMTSGDRDWRRITVTADQCSRIAPAFLDREQHPARRCALSAGIRLRVPRRARLGLLGRRARGDVRQGRDRCRRRRWRTSSSRIERRPVRSLSGGSSTPSAMPSARRCGCLQQSSDESGKGEPFWYIDGGNGYVTVSPDGDGYWIGLNGSPMLVAWARAQLAAFSTIRRVGANSLLAEMAVPAGRTTRPPCFGRPWRCP